MGALFRDTSEASERVFLDALRRKSPAERYQLVEDSSECLRQLVKQGIRMRHPNAGEDELRCRFAALWLGRELAIQVYGWDPDQHGWG